MLLWRTIVCGKSCFSDLYGHEVIFQCYISEHLLYMSGCGLRRYYSWKIYIPWTFGYAQPDEIALFLVCKAMEPMERFPSSLRLTKPVTLFVGLKPNTPMCM